MNDLAKRLRLARENCGLTQQYVAQTSGIGYKTINNYENGASRPDVDKLATLCRVYDVSADYFLDMIPTNAERNLTPEEQQCVVKYRALNDHGKKVVNSVLEAEYERAMAGSVMQGSTILECLIPVTPEKEGMYYSGFYSRQIEVPVSEITKDADYSLEVASMCLEPVYYRGDILAVARRVVEHNGIGIFWVDGISYVRKLYDKDGVKKLIPFNVDCTELVIKNVTNCKCLGKVLGVIRGEVRLISDSREIVKLE